MNEFSQKTAFAGIDLLSSLLEDRVVSANQAEQVRRRVQRTGVSPQKALVDLGYASQEVVYRHLAACHSLPFVSLEGDAVEAEAIRQVPVKVALHYHCVPLRIRSGILSVAFAEPLALRARENLRLLLGLRVQPAIASPGAIRHALKEYYGLGAETVMQLRQDWAFQKRVDTAVTYDDVGGQDLQDGDKESASIIHLVNQILLEALALNATDIHLEPFPQRLRLRYRIDGMLRDIPTPPGMRELHEAIVTRMKVMASLNIAEKRLPHDGRIRVRIGEEHIDLRVSILPTRFGETLCLRILNRKSIFMELMPLGFNPQQLALFTDLIDLPHGLILITGPTGCGKTTTLYAALAKVRNASPERKIVTVEDPVEYELEDISQIQIRAEIGLSFASGLRSILRHDPDIILVGEIRDAETADIAIRSALTGHLVLSTLHTNDSVGAVTRLVEMGVEPFLVASSLLASLAQRLVRRICPHCKEPIPEIPAEIAREMAESLGLELDQLQAFRGSGCLECSHTGYHGRVAVLEIFLMDEEMEDMVSRRAATRDLRLAARANGMRTLRDSGWEKVQDGLTSIAEITRITGTQQLTYNA
jgi:type II secretory ATPase GspE/PulE/Tfp pilus assembly ATPase PilB-like protein